VGERRLVTVDLGDGNTILAEVEVVDPEANISIVDKVPFAEVTKSIDAITQQVLSALRRAKPQKATVEFGLAIGAEAGQLTSLLVKGKGDATLKITLEWESSGLVAPAGGQP
jgi:hypothetical protein